jgi:hypothetical protein
LFTVADTDTVIGVVMGPDVGNDTVGSATKWLTAFQAWAGWAGKPMAGSYLYPNYDNSQWVLKIYQGAGPMCWGSAVIPADQANFTNPKKATSSEVATLLSNVRAGKLDSRWKTLATTMVSLGHTDGIYRTGFEGNGNNFPGAAGVVGDAAYAEIMQRHLSVMKSVPGWNYLPEWNYSVHQAQANGLNPDAAWCKQGIGVVGMDIYDVGGYTQQGWTATDHAAVWKGDILPQLEDQARFADKHGLRMGITEFGPLWKSDGHGGADARYFLDHLFAWVTANNPSHCFLFNGSNLPGDEARVAVPGPVGTYKFTDNPRYPTAAPAVRELFDPSLFVGRSSMPMRALSAAKTQITNLTVQVSSLSAQVATLTPTTPSATVINNAVAAATSPLNDKISTLADQLRTSQDALNTANTSLTAAQAAVSAANAHAASDDAQVATVTGQLSDATRHLADATSQVTSLQATIAKIKADLGA